MDAAESELSYPAANVSLPLLQSLLDAGGFPDWMYTLGCGFLIYSTCSPSMFAAIRSSSAAGDEAASLLRVSYDSRSLLNMLISVTQTGNDRVLATSPTRRGTRPVTSGQHAGGEKAMGTRARSVRESFMLTYDVPWPVSIVAPQAAIAQYQMVFRYANPNSKNDCFFLLAHPRSIPTLCPQLPSRHILELKWVERELSRVWLLYQRTAPLANHGRRSREEARAASAFGAPR